MLAEAELRVDLERKMWRIKCPKSCKSLLCCNPGGFEMTRVMRARHSSSETSFPPRTDCQMLMGAPSLLSNRCESREGNRVPLLVRTGISSPQDEGKGQMRRWIRRDETATM